MENIILCCPACPKEPLETLPFPTMVGSQFLGLRGRGTMRRNNVRMGNSGKDCLILCPGDIRGTLSELEQKPFPEPRELNLLGG